jgi:hypothetical protein
MYTAPPALQLEMMQEFTSIYLHGQRKKRHHYEERQALRRQNFEEPFLSSPDRSRSIRGGGRSRSTRGVDPLSTRDVDPLSTRDVDPLSTRDVDTRCGHHLLSEDYSPSTTTTSFSESVATTSGQHNPTPEASFPQPVDPVFPADEEQFPTDEIPADLSFDALDFDMGPVA